MKKTDELSERSAGYIGVGILLMVVVIVLYVLFRYWGAYEKTDLVPLSGKLSSYSITGDSSKTLVLSIFRPKNHNLVVLCVPYVGFKNREIRTGSKIDALGYKESLTFLSSCNYQIMELAINDELIISYADFVKNEKNMIKVANYIWLLFFLIGAFFIYHGLTRREKINDLQSKDIK